MRPPWMDPDAPGPTAVCVTNPEARDAHRWASDVPGGPAAAAVIAAHKEAKFWCDRCYVQASCLSFALAAEGRDDDRGRDGVYGALDPVQRATLAGRPPKPNPGPTPAAKARRGERRHRVALSVSVACPKCERPKGKQCLTPAGNRTEPHLVRIQAAEATGVMAA